MIVNYIFARNGDGASLNRYGHFISMADKNSGYYLTRKWFDFCRSTDQNIKPIHTAIYLYTIYLCNLLRWKPIFQLPTSETMKVLGISNYTTYRVALEEVIRFGFIIMVEKSSNQYTANRICLVQNSSTTVLSTVSTTVLSTVSKVKQLKHKNVVSVKELKTGIVNLFLKLRSDVPRESLEIEAAFFIEKYGEKDFKNDLNLYASWAKKITYTKPVNQADEFNKLAEQNRKKYGYS